MLPCSDPQQVVKDISVRMLLSDQNSPSSFFFSKELSPQGQGLSGQGNWRNNWLQQQPNCSLENEENSDSGASLKNMPISSSASQLPVHGRTQNRSREGSSRGTGSFLAVIAILKAKSRDKRNVGGGNFLFQTKRITPRLTSRFRLLAPQADKHYRYKSQGKLSLLYKV